MACEQMPALVLELGKDGMDSDAEAELGTALVLHHPDGPAAARIASQPRASAVDAMVSRNGSDLLPRCGALLMLGDADAAANLLQQPGTYWLQARLLGPQRLAAMAGEGEDERRGAMARIGAVLAARLQASGDATAAARLRARLRAATSGLTWRLGDWLGQ